MNLFKLHDNPEDLHRHKDKDTHVPKVFWNKYVGDKEELQKREDAIAKDPIMAAKYTVMYLKKPWPEAETAISKSAHASVQYASSIIKGPWPKGEDAIAKDTFYSRLYAKEVLKAPFKKGELKMAKNAYDAAEYARAINQPFIAGESAIAKSHFASNYIKQFPERKDAIEKLK